MNRKLSAFAIAAVLAASPLASPARAQVDVHIGIPLPHIVFESEPQVVIVPNTDVYYAPSVSEYDTYRVGPYWYANRGGNWYRSRDYRQQFRPIPYSRVPRQIGGLPGEYRRYPVRPERRDIGNRQGYRGNRQQGNRGGQRQQRGDSRHQDKHHQHD